MSPRPARIRRRIVRRAIRAPIRRSVRRTRRIFLRRTRRLLFGTSVILLVGGSYGIYKLSQRDVQKIEEETKKSADDLTEEEFKAAMRKLGIEKLELTLEEEAAIDKVETEVSTQDTKSYCIYCGSKLEQNSKFCRNCGQKV
ncbi:MAG: zinc ribbon domain-containing protein [Promethearchaeota archaeon]